MNRKENIKKLNKRVQSACAVALMMVVAFVPSLYASQGFGPGINENQQTTGFFSDSIYPLEGDFNASTYAGHSGAGALDLTYNGQIYNQPIYAVEDGVVQTAQDSCANIGYIGSSCNGGYGNHVIIDHGSGYDTLYGHMISGSVQVKQGQEVKEGDVIGYVGTSGNSSGPHLHFEIRQNNVSVPVKNYFYIPNIQFN